ncbi:MAG: hypothetical protein HQL49_06890 [Gammaproteobacteria bacterium]|nr:hypothetical protein [Gammaproteobacteria bacterium]
MHQLRALVLLLLLLGSAASSAFELNAEGVAKTAELARKAALATLSESLKIEVSSSFKQQRDQSGRIKAQQAITTHSALPLLGVEIQLNPVKEGYLCYAWFNRDKSAPLYINELNALTAEIDNEAEQLSKLKDSGLRYQQLNKLMTLGEQFSSYAAVARLLNATPIPALNIDLPALQNELLTLEQAAPTLAIAGSLLTRDLPSGKYFIEAALPQNGYQATMLSRLLIDAMRPHLVTHAEYQEANLTLKGRYEIVEKGIIVSYRAENSQGVSVASRMVKLAPSAYADIAYQPDSNAFEQRLHDIPLPDSLRVALSSNHGDQGLLFTSEQQITLRIKFNQPAYYYLVAHHSEADLAYLLAVNDDPTKNPYIGKVDAKELNRWIEIGSYEVTPPFGEENLHLIASNSDLTPYLPPYINDRQYNLPRLRASNRDHALTLTRSSQQQITQQDKNNKTAEAVLSYRTMR